jgi:hypothetical protein
VRTHRLVAVAVCVLALAACGGPPPRAARPLPDDVAPPSLEGLTVAREGSADAAFRAAGDASMIASGGVWTARSADGALVAALQVSVLEPKYDTRDIAVRRGVRANIETGRYRWQKVLGQWVGIQELAETRLYLWFPPAGDLFEVLQVRRSDADPLRLLTGILRHQQEKPT